MSKSRSFLEKAMPLVYSIVAVPVFLFVILLFLENGFGLIGGPVCLTEVRGRLSGLSGLDFEISETGCSAIAKDDAVSVLVSKAGERKKTLLFKYDPVYVDPYPTITSIDEHTVEISISRVSFIFCRRDRWDALTVKYDIGVVDYPDAQPAGC